MFKTTQKNRFILLAIAVVLLIQIVISFFADIVRVDARQVAVVTRQGEVSQVLGAGWHLKTPYITKEAAVYDISTQNMTVNASAASLDQQAVEMVANLQYQLQADKIEQIFRTIGGSGNGGNFPDDRIDNIIRPILQESIKSASAQFSATDLLIKREELRDAIIDGLNRRLERYYIDVLTVNIENIEFSAQFNQAIEDKVTAQQKAEQARFELETEKAKLEQEKVRAEALRVRGQALKDNPQILEEEKIKKWDGKLPQVQGGNGGVIIDLDR